MNNLFLKVVWNSHINYAHTLECEKSTCSFHTFNFFFNAKDVGSSSKNQWLDH